MAFINLFLGPKQELSELNESAEIMAPTAAETTTTTEKSRPNTRKNVEVIEIDTGSDSRINSYAKRVVCINGACEITTCINGKCQKETKNF